MQSIQLKLRGTSPLLCHNIQLADPDNAWVRQIAEITAKRKKTEEDRRQIERLEWYGGLYVAPGIEGPAIPTGNIRKCLINAGKITKQGTQVARAISFTSQFVPVAYEGSRNIDELFKQDAFKFRAFVGVGTKRVARMRPHFQNWALVAEAILLDDVMDPYDLQRIVALAGLSEGLGDGNKIGFGRFEGEIE